MHQTHVHTKLLTNLVKKNLENFKTCCLSFQGTLEINMGEKD